MSTVDKIKAEYATKLAAAELEDNLRAKLPGTPAFVHVAGQSLYGTVASVKYEKGYAYDAPPVTLEDAKAIIAALPPVALTLVKDSCTSIRPSSYVEALPEAKKERWKEETGISSVYVEIEALHGPTMSLHWVANVEGVGLVRVEVTTGYPTIGLYTAKRTEYMGGVKYGPASFSAKPDLHTVMSSGEPMAQLESPIRWASGGPEYPSRITLYFVDLGADMDPGVVGKAIVDHLASIT